ncbi:MAG: hypothetical protein M0002_09990 [Rhodospirillales bacterium]|nr:hypothetical protein [Rhodospirillales bacterium]
MDLDTHALAHAELVHRRAKFHDGPHVFVAEGEVAVEGEAALDHGREPKRQHREVGRADRRGVDAHKRLRRARLRRNLLDEAQFARCAKHPGLHHRRYDESPGERPRQRRRVVADIHRLPLPRHARRAA